MTYVFALFLGLAAIVPPAPAEDFAAEYRRILEAGSANGRDVESQTATELTRQLWALLGRRAVAILSSDPGVSAGALAATMSALQDEAGVQIRSSELAVTAVELPARDGRAFAIAASFGTSGTVFVVGPRDDGFSVVWSITDQAEASQAHGHRTPLDVQLGVWAPRSHKAGRAAFGGTVRALPAGPDGYPRFYVDAIASSGMGQERPAQISVWELRDGQVACLDIKSYWTSSLTDRVALEGDRLRVRVQERFKTMYPCVDCETAEAIWTLHVKDSGISELSRVTLVPELRLVDELLFRLQARESVAELASSAVEQQLAPLVANAAEPGDAQGFVGVLADWKVSSNGGSSQVELQLDGLPRLAFTIGSPAGRSFVEAVKVLD